MIREDSPEIEMTRSWIPFDGSKRLPRNHCSLWLKDGGSPIGSGLASSINSRENKGLEALVQFSPLMAFQKRYV